MSCQMVLFGLQNLEESANLFFGFDVTTTDGNGRCIASDRKGLRQMSEPGFVH